MGRTDRAIKGLYPSQREANGLIRMKMEVNAIYSSSNMRCTVVFL